MFVYTSYSDTAAVCSVVFPVLSMLVVALRLRARYLTSLGYGNDDYLILVALSLTIALCCLVLYMSQAAGLGSSLSLLTPPEFTKYSRHLYFVVILTHLVRGIIKLSVLSFYKRIFTTKGFHLAANIVMGFVCAATIGSFFTQVFSAWPISDWWTLGKQYDINYGAFVTAFAAVDIALDIATLSLPLPVIKNLHISRKRKYQLVGIFWLGLFCVAAAAVRLYYGYQLSLAGNAAKPSDAHFSYVSVNAITWSQIECCCSIVAGSLPTLGPLLKRLHSPESLARSIRSFVSKHSGSSPSSSVREISDSSSNEESPSRSNARRAWYKLHISNNDTSCTGDVEKGYQDIQNQDPGEIRVDKTFTSQIKEGKGKRDKTTIPRAVVRD